MIAVNLTGVWHTIRAAVPHIRAGGRGGSIVLTSSTAGLMGMENIGHYDERQHGHDPESRHL
jgi:NAD(P)-dependent dehydrogenase (short-subunit alcohol dehydrogenase family)